MKYTFIVTNKDINHSKVVVIEATSKQSARAKVVRMNPYDKISSKLGRELQKIAYF